MIVSTCMIVPVYMHNWQGCCVMIQPIQLQWTNRCLLLVLCTAAAQARPQMFHIIYSNVENGCVESLKAPAPGNEARTRSRVRVRVSID